MHVLKLSSVDLEELTKRLNHLTLQSTEAPTISGVGLNVDEGGFRNEFLNPRKVIGFCFFLLLFPFLTDVQFIVNLERRCDTM